MAARSLERDAVSKTPHGDVRRAKAGAVDRDKPIDLPFHALAKQIFHAAKIAEPFFADRPHKGDRARRLNVCFHHCACDGQDHRQTAAVIANAWPAKNRSLTLDGDVRPFREDRVEMRAEHESRLRLRAALVPQHIALFVDPHVDESDIAKHLCVQLRAFGLFERRRLHLAQTNLVFDGLRLRRADRLDSGFDRRVLQQAFA
jgi:hypothetical protein